MHEIFESIHSIVQQTIMISGFVLYMMLILEYINVRSKGKWSQPIKKSGFVQIGIANTIGIIPGCVGIFTIVSLFTHNIIKFPALLSGSIATMGDEAFVMLTMIPTTTFKLGGILLIIAFAVGGFFQLFFKNKFAFTANETHFHHHEHDDCLCFNRKSVIAQLKNISFHRALLITVLVMIVLFQLFGGHGHEHGEHSEAIWENLFFVIASIFSIAIVITVPEHFLVEHLWGHILKKHFLKIFLWTLISLSLITLIMNYWNIESWVQENTYFMLLLALLVGIIPISGPHILFITLFASGSIPFSILLANTIVQEGHGGLPLMADAKKSFVIMKFIKIIIALIIGLIGIYYRW
ncbi:MAG TPA: hypothetical protein DDX39_08145 [Bacteroidales bacterium]|nr:MAG: hypothetical protein A2W98_14810 [Bacteroidetes bacterium GWF2_33_38]OFY91324.1 MAG: hypothetical protein A2236_13710 [Bacteroidetes bacterium RIFOXYA2_FULL_33_7]HBF88598.1 hypothetical protein [Bacteroidales bacterium]